jgi:hypothetical protein
MGDGRCADRALVGRTDGKFHLEDLAIDVGIILKLIFKKWDNGRGLK